MNDFPCGGTFKSFPSPLMHVIPLPTQPNGRVSAEHPGSGWLSCPVLWCLGCTQLAMHQSISSPCGTAPQAVLVARQTFHTGTGGGAVSDSEGKMLILVTEGVRTTCVYQRAATSAAILRQTLPKGLGFACRAIGKAHVSWTACWRGNRNP